MKKKNQMPAKKGLQGSEGKDQTREKKGREKKSDKWATGTSKAIKRD